MSKTDYFSETKKVARRIKLLEKKRDYVSKLLTNDELPDAKRHLLRADLSALTWVLEHVEKTRELAFADALVIDMSRPEYHEHQAKIRQRIAAREAGLDSESPNSC